MFLDAMKELTATLLLSPTGLNTLATQVWAHTSNIEFAAAAPYAALLIDGAHRCLRKTRIRPQHGC